ncbi:hypothetical protein HDU76_014047 [Blyttiomyces sp. JEL0837]|nr:hypothetical protein HDU76_014047 [Blyttiomyces sp. JEL0837]
MHNHDVWGSDDISDFDHDKAMAERNWNKMQDIHGVAGYREGLLEAKEAGLQKGFDIGYKEGILVGMRLGKALGAVSTLKTKASQAINLDPKSEPLQTLITSEQSLHSKGAEQFFQKPSDKAKGSTPAGITQLEQVEEQIRTTLKTAADENPTSNTSIKFE